MFCWSFAGCGRSEYGSIDMSKTHLGIEGEIIPKAKAAHRPADPPKHP
jgi:hypothetical protein